MDAGISVRRGRSPGTAPALPPQGALLAGFLLWVATGWERAEEETMAEHRKVMILVATLVGLAAVSATLAARAKDEAREGPGARTTITAELPSGRILVLSTGTDGGDCTVHGSRLICLDGGSLAIADLGEGCVRVARGGRCRIVGMDSVADEVPEGLGLSPQNSSIDVECEEGEKSGYVFTISDTDGRAICGVNKGVSGKVIGGTCTKDGSECAGLDCVSGCLSGNSNCECRIKSMPGRRARTSD